MHTCQHVYAVLFMYIPLHGLYTNNAFEGHVIVGMVVSYVMLFVLHFREILTTSITVYMFFIYKLRCPVWFLQNTKCYSTTGVALIVGLYFSK
mgnify:CR=1 FL=1